LAENDDERVRLTIADADDLTVLIGQAPAVAAWTHQPPPVAAQNHPYYLPTTQTE